MSTPAPEGYVPHGLDVLRTYGEGFAGREDELAAVDRAWLTQVRGADWRVEGYNAVTLATPTDVTCPVPMTYPTGEGVSK